MARGVALDTSFLIDLQRERSRGDRSGHAHRFLAAQPGRELHLPMTALGEIAEGFARDDDPVLQAVRELHVLLPIDEATALEYGRLARFLRDSGRLIRANDLWIAASSLRHRLPLVTADGRAFRRVEGLELVEYRHR